jgi:hypothetical protein
VAKGLTEKWVKDHSKLDGEKEGWREEKGGWGKGKGKGAEVPADPVW